MKYNTFTEILLEKYNGYKPVKLPYSYNSLEPYIDEETMYLHYNKHYKGYISKLNDLLPNNNTDLVQLVKKAYKKKDDIRNNAGGAYNHQIFWSMISPEKTSISGNIKEKIENKFGDFNGFKKVFQEKALTEFGSGWIWLIQKNNKLEITTTDNQDNPIMFGDVKVLLGCDLWEHAYYKKYGPDRAKYVNNFLKVVNWDYCNMQLLD